MTSAHSILKNIVQVAKHATWQRSHILTILSTRHQHQNVPAPQTAIQPQTFPQSDMDPFGKVDETKESFIQDLRPPLKRSYNLAAYVNASKTLQEFVRLGVSLYDIENTNAESARKLVLLDFEKDCMPHIKLLADNGLKGSNIGRFISEYPNVFQIPLEDLGTRIEYLREKGFTEKQISKALNRSSQIVANNVKSLDYKLGEFQVEFRMPAQVIRGIVSSYPPVVSLPRFQYTMVNFSLRDEFGFSVKEIHEILAAQPKTLDILRPKLIDRLDLVHNTIGLSHSTICRFPKLLTGPIIEIRQRFAYLEKLKRNQFDPRKPLYVPPSALYNFDDEQFCQRYAKTSVQDYKLFLKNC